MNNLHVKTGDTAVVLSGKEKGKRGKVLSVDPKKGMVVIEGVNMVKCHTKPRRQGETGVIVEQALIVHIVDIHKIHAQLGEHVGRDLAGDPAARARPAAS